MNDILQWIESNPFLSTIFFIVFTYVLDISKIKVNPWKWVFRNLGRAINGETMERLQRIENDISTMKQERQDDQLEQIRWNVLDFGNSCKHKREHTKEEWQHVVSQIKKYEQMCKDNNVTNGVMEEESKYLLALYQTLNAENRFLP